MLLFFIFVSIKKRSLNFFFFLFNTFNTLYGISLKYPERTSDMIMKVSQLMRYQVENGNKEFVSLQDELEFISSYIELEKERVGYRCDISFQQDVDFESNYKIAPMLLITFIENAFKHTDFLAQDSFISIYMELEDGIFTMKVSNKASLKNILEKEKSGFGSQSFDQRLKMIYSTYYQLEKSSKNGVFTAELKINLGEFYDKMRYSG